MRSRRVGAPDLVRGHVFAEARPGRRRSGVRRRRCAARGDGASAAGTKRSNAGAVRVCERSQYSFVGVRSSMISKKLDPLRIEEPGTNGVGAPAPLLHHSHVRCGLCEPAAAWARSWAPASAQASTPGNSAATIFSASWSSRFFRPSSMSKLDPRPAIPEGVRLVFRRWETVAVEDVSGLVAETERPMCDMATVKQSRPMTFLNETVKRALVVDLANGVQDDVRQCRAVVLVVPQVRRDRGDVLGLEHGSHDLLQGRLPDRSTPRQSIAFCILAATPMTHAPKCCWSSARCSR